MAVKEQIDTEKLKVNMVRVVELCVTLHFYLGLRQSLASSQIVGAINDRIYDLIADSLQILCIEWVLEEAA